MTPTPSRRAFRYALALIFLQAIVSSVCLFLVTRPWFLDRKVAPYYRIVGFAQRAAGMNCQVVAYGDSTALSDLIPAEIEARTGLKTCNISEFREVGDFVGIDFPLDAYLARNAPPRFIVAGFNAGNFQLSHPSLLVMHPGDFGYAVRYNHGPWLWSTMLHHPGATVEFLVWIENTLVADLLVPRISPPPAAGDDRFRRDRDAGYWSIAKPPETHCTGRPNKFPEFTFAENQAGVAQFRQRYSTPATRVIVLATPIAQCVPELQHLIETTHGLADAPLQVLPISNFNDQDIHLDRPAAILYSRQISDQILASMHAQAPGQEKEQTAR